MLDLTYCANASKCELCLSCDRNPIKLDGIDLGEKEISYAHFEHYDDEKCEGWIFYPMKDEWSKKC